MRFLILVLFFTAIAEAKLPSGLPGPGNIKTVLFKEMKTYMFQVAFKSQVFNLGPNCRLYKFNDLGVPDSRRALKFCLHTKAEEGIIDQTLQVQITGEFGGSFRYVQEGKKVKPLSLSQFMAFQFPETKKGQKTSFYFDHFSFGLVSNRLSFPEKLDAFLLIRSFELNIFENIENGYHYRNFLLSCEDCHGVSWLKVQSNGENTSYFTGNDTAEVTPAHFNKQIVQLIITPFTQLGMQLKEKLISDLRWPTI